MCPLINKALHVKAWWPLQVFNSQQCKEWLLPVDICCSHYQQQHQAHHQCWVESQRFCSVKSTGCQETEPSWYGQNCGNPGFQQSKTQASMQLCKLTNSRNCLSGQTAETFCHELSLVTDEHLRPTTVLVAGNCLTIFTPTAEQSLGMHSLADVFVCHVLSLVFTHHDYGQCPVSCLLLHFWSLQCKMWVHSGDKQVSAINDQQIPTTKKDNTVPFIRPQPWRYKM